MKHKAQNAAILTLVFAAAVTAQSTEIEQLRLAAEQGDANAQYNLGLTYYNGEGVPQNYQEAVKWYCLAAEQGNADAQFGLGMHAFDKAVPQDYVQAHKWINLAASRATPEEAGDYRSVRNEVAEQMTASQVAEAQRLAREWQPKTWEQLKVNPEAAASESCSSLGDVVTTPVLLNHVTPSYSDEARKAKVEGTVILEIIIRRDGTAEVVRVTRSVGFGLDQKAIEAVTQYRFRPGMRNGEPVDVTATSEVNFNLR